MGKIYPGSIGLHIILNTGIDLDGATETYYMVTLPDGTETTWAATPIDGTQKLEYFTQEGDLPDDVYGDFLLQTMVKRGSDFEVPGETYKLHITAFGK